jgi:SAM-dependent methyltransferase
VQEPSPLVSNRRAYLLRHVTPARHRGLEIGPYHQPTVRKHEGDVRYLDFFSTAELEAREHDQRPAGAVIPVVDYVVKSDDYYRYVPDQFDYVVANHVFEHVDNPVQWVVDLARLLRPDGVLFLTIPDKKYNFDRFRTDTTLAHLLTDFFRGHGDPHEHGVDIALNYDTAYIGKPIDLAHKLDLDRLRSVYGEKSHPGRHNHVFQSETFVARILRPLQRLKLWRFQLLEFGGAPENRGEFYLVLRLGEEQVELTPRELYGPAAEPAATEAVRDDAEPRSAEADEAELLRLRAELAATRDELASMRRSLSWRATGPVRRLLDVFH